MYLQRPMNEQFIIIILFTESLLNAANALIPLISLLSVLCVLYAPALILMIFSTFPLTPDYGPVIN